MASFSQRMVPVDGGVLNVTIAGEGPAVLLVHGFPDDHKVWRHQITALSAAGYQVIAPDTRGCGDSFLPVTAADYRLPLLVDDLRRVLDALDLDKVFLVGHDWGAVIAWQFVMAHSERVIRYAALSVGHPLAYATDGVGQKLRGWYALMFQMRGVAEWLLKANDWRLFGYLTGHVGERASWVDGLSRPGRLTAGLNYYRANLVELLLRRDFPPVTRPVLGIWSDGDRFLTERQMVRSQQLVGTGWEYRRVHGAGHWLQLDAPDVVSEWLVTFFQENSYVTN